MILVAAKSVCKVLNRAIIGNPGNVYWKIKPVNIPSGIQYHQNHIKQNIFSIFTATCLILTTKPTRLQPEKNVVYMIEGQFPTSSFSMLNYGVDDFGWAFHRAWMTRNSNCLYSVMLSWTVTTHHCAQSSIFNICLTLTHKIDVSFYNQFRLLIFALISGCDMC